MTALVGADVIAAASAEPALVRHTHGVWHSLGASVRGKSHAHRGEYRDDALAIHHSADLVVLVVADGAGSSESSRVGAAVTAQLAVSQTVARYAQRTADEPRITALGTAIAYAVHDAALHLHALAAAADVLPQSLRTTVVIVAIAGDVMLMAQVGDGAVLMQRTDGSVVRVGVQRETGWAGEVNCFVPDACAMTQVAELRQVKASDVALIALMTDGIDDPFHPLEQTGAQLVTQWRVGTSGGIGVANQPRTGPVLGDAEALLRWLSFEQRGEVDDRTLLLAWRDVAVSP